MEVVSPSADSAEPVDSTAGLGCYDVMLGTKQRKETIYHCDVKVY